MNTTNANDLKRSSGTCCPDSHDEVASLAFAAFERDGSEHGRDIRNWLDAEARVKAKHSTEKHAHHVDHHARSASSR